MSLSSFPCLISGDGFEIVVREDPKEIVITEILRFANNENVDPTSEYLLDLDHVVRTSIIRYVNRRYPKKSVRPNARPTR